MQKIISWNVASFRARLPLVKMLIEKENPDVLLLQEMKLEAHQYPFEEMEKQGYYTVLCGQKSWNGVAVLAKKPLETQMTCLDGFADQARFVEAVLSDGTTLISVYVPNGQPPEKMPQDTSRLKYKLAWMQALNAYITQKITAKEKFILGGDFNVIFQDGDVYNPTLFEGNALMVPSVREKLAQLHQTGVVNAIRQFHPQSGLYTFWDFQGGAWPRNHGILLDALYVSPTLKGCLMDAGVLKEYRAFEKPSDHVPIYCVLDEAVSSKKV